MGGHIRCSSTRNILQSYALAKGTEDHKGFMVIDHESHPVSVGDRTSLSWGILPWLACTNLHIVKDVQKERKPEIREIERCLEKWKWKNVFAAEQWCALTAQTLGFQTQISKGYGHPFSWTDGENLYPVYAPAQIRWHKMLTGRIHSNHNSIFDKGFLLNMTSASLALPFLCGIDSKEREATVEFSI